LHLLSFILPPSSFHRGVLLGEQRASKTRGQGSNPCTPAELLSLPLDCDGVAWVCKQLLSGGLLAILVQNDVGRFQIAVEDAATVGISHRVTHIHERAEKPAQFQRAFDSAIVFRLRIMELGDRIFEAGPVDDPHGIEGASILKVAEAVDRNDAPMLQAPGHLGFVKEAGLALGIVGPTFLINLHTRESSNPSSSAARAPCD
jgi:hypothetical protein